MSAFDRELYKEMIEECEKMADDDTRIWIAPFVEAFVLFDAKQIEAKALAVALYNLLTHSLPKEYVELFIEEGLAMIGVYDDEELHEVFRQMKEMHSNNDNGEAPVARAE